MKALFDQFFNGIEMKKIRLGLCLMAAFSVAHADELVDAQKAWDAKDFSTAFQLFTKLANQGNGVAQLQLGEMYGFGEGTPENAELAARWLERAVAAGTPDAAASLELVQQRKARKAEITYYTTNFSGANVAYDKFKCVNPVIPKVSTTNEDIASVNAAVNSWSECYGRFVKNMNGAIPVKNTIPVDVLNLMSQAEFQQADVLMSATYEKIASDAKKIADGIMLDNARWKAETEEYVSNSNDQQKAQIARLERLNEMDARHLKNIKDMKSIRK